MLRSTRLYFAACAIVFAAYHSALAQQVVLTDTRDGIDEQRRALFTQRASLQRQMGETQFRALLGTTFYGGITETRIPITAACPPLERGRREDLIASAARMHNIDAGLLRAVMHHESAFRPCAVSIKGAVGLMQLMPATISQFGVTDPLDAAQSTYAGAGLLRILLDRYDGDVVKTLAAYNAGPVRIDTETMDGYPAETRSYISAILQELGKGAGSAQKAN